MRSYMKDIVAMESVEFPPDHFWLEDFELFVENKTNALDGLSFGEKVDQFLAVPTFFNLYHEDIVQDGSTRNVIESRAYVRMDNVDWEEIDDQVKALQEQRKVTYAQPINEGREGNSLKFFMYEGMFSIWSFYETSLNVRNPFCLPHFRRIGAQWLLVKIPFTNTYRTYSSTTLKELVRTTIYGITAVTGVALVIIPHWSAAPIVFPFICILYVDLLGVMQWAGLNINAVSYLGLVMSIGLLVDYLVVRS